MGQAEMEQFIERMTADPELRSAFQLDPEGTLRKSGVDLTEEEIAGLKSTEWDRLSDEELVGRISKTGQRFLLISG